MQRTHPHGSHPRGPFGAKRWRVAHLRLQQRLEPRVVVLHLAHGVAESLGLRPRDDAVAAARRRRVALRTRHKERASRERRVAKTAVSTSARRERTRPIRRGAAVAQMRVSCASVSAREHRARRSCCSARARKRLRKGLLA
eukprot:6174922-Pleurochrysis_carterae.AAC.1